MPILGTGRGVSGFGSGAIASGNGGVSIRISIIFRHYVFPLTDNLTGTFELPNNEACFVDSDQLALNGVTLTPGQDADYYWQDAKTFVLAADVQARIKPNSVLHLHCILG